MGAVDMAAHVVVEAGEFEFPAVVVMLVLMLVWVPVAVVASWWMTALAKAGAWLMSAPWPCLNLPLGATRRNSHPLPVLCLCLL